MKHYFLIFQLQNKYLEDSAFKNHVFCETFKRRKPSISHWMNFSTDSSACNITVSQIQKRDELDAELYHSLYEHKEDIEATLKGLRN